MGSGELLPFGMLLSLPFTSSVPWELFSGVPVRFSFALLPLSVKPVGTVGVTWLEAVVGGRGS